MARGFIWNQWGKEEGFFHAGVTSTLDLALLPFSLAGTIVLPQWQSVVMRKLCATPEGR